MTHNYRPDWVEPHVMNALGYKLVSDQDGYLKYENLPGTQCTGYGVMPPGKRTVYFNTTYNDKYVFVGIKEDADTRTVFNGAVESASTFRTILSAVR